MKLRIPDFTGKRKLEAVFAGRVSRDSSEFYQSFFSDHGYPREVVIKIMNIFDRKIGFDLSRISAEDDFSRELKFIWDYDSLADVEIIQEIENEFSISIQDCEAKNLKSIHDLVRCVSGKIRT